MHSNDCTGCKHAPVNWGEYSKLPTCTHPSHSKKVGGVWQIYNRTNCVRHEVGDSAVVILDLLYDHKTNRELEESIQYCQERLTEAISALGEDNRVCKQYRLQIKCEQRLLKHRLNL